MAFVPVPNTAMCEVRGTLFGQQIENTLYFEFSTPPSQADLDTLADAVGLWWRTTVMTTNLSQDYTYRETFVTDLTTATSPTAVSIVGAGTAGSIANPSMPGNVAIVVSIRTAGRGRSSRGRNFISGLPQTYCVANAYDGTEAGQLTTAYDTLITTPPTGWEWVVVSRFTAGAPRVTGQTIPVTSAGVVDLYLDSQRRRLTGRGM